MFRRLLVVCGLLIGTALPLLPQASTNIPGVSEPPELSGEPKKVVAPTEVEQQLAQIRPLKGGDEGKAALLLLDKFIQEHPDYSDAYFLRATLNACLLNSRDFGSIMADIDAAMSHPGSAVYNKTDYYSLRGRIAYENQNYEEVLRDLELAMTRDIDSATQMFNITGVEPEKTSEFCTWNITELDSLVAKFPTDYRARILRGLYYEFFTTFKEDYYQKAAPEFQKALLLNPKSALSHYFIGQLSTKASFWTKKAWASDEGRDEATRTAIQAYTKAIQLDPKLLAAYEQRASGHLNLKEYSLAIKDFDRVLALDPDYSAAYSDRGIAKLEIGQYFSATMDFGDAIRRKSEHDSFLPSVYEYRGDAYVKLGDYRSAIADYSRAIEEQLSIQIILLNLRQFRALYPEYDKVSDEVVIRKLNVLFSPQFEFHAFAEQLGKNQDWAVSELNELYEKRGDAYLRAGDFRWCVLDFNRIFKGIPNFASSTDRWRRIGAGADGEAFYLDVKTAEFPGTVPVRIWIKSGKKGRTQTVAYEIDCDAKRLRTDSEVTYDLKENVVRSSDQSGDWQSIIPDTIGEQFYNGACGSVVIAP